MKKVLIAATNNLEIKGKISQSEYFDGLKIPYLKLKELGYSIEMASPKGGKSFIDFKNIKDENQEYVSLFENTSKLSEINISEFSCIYIPGSEGSMFDLAKNQDLAKIIETLKHTRKVISALGLGVCGLISAKETRGEPYVKGKALTGFSNQDVKDAGLNEFLPFSLEDELKELGANFMSKAPNESFVLEDNYLITGQNQNSIKEFTEKLSLKLERLNREG